MRRKLLTVAHHGLRGDQMLQQQLWLQVPYPRHVMLQVPVLVQGAQAAGLTNPQGQLPAPH